MIDLEGMPQFDEPTSGQRARLDRAERLRAMHFEQFGALVPKIASDTVAHRVEELRGAYKAELGRLCLLLHCDGLRRVYAKEDRREYLLDGRGMKLAAIWIVYPDPGEWIVVIRTEIYAVPIVESGSGHGAAGRA